MPRTPYAYARVASGCEEIPHVQGLEWGREEIPHVQGLERGPRGDTPHPRSGAGAEEIPDVQGLEQQVAERRYPMSKVWSGAMRIYPIFKVRETPLRW